MRDPSSAPAWVLLFAPHFWRDRDRQILIDGDELRLTRFETGWPGTYQVDLKLKVILQPQLPRCWGSGVLYQPTFCFVFPLNFLREDWRWAAQGKRTERILWGGR